MERQLVTRLASLEDLYALIRHVQAGFDSYVEFAPPGWRPRSVEADREWMAGLLADAQTWALLGLVDGRPVGHVGFVTGRERVAGDRRHWSERPIVAGLAHFWQLFVLPAWWGTGVAPVLHDAALAEMRAREYRHARLYTPSLNLRARRFYERRGWAAQGEAWNEDIRLVLTEYTISLALSSER